MQLYNKQIHSRLKAVLSFRRERLENIHFWTMIGFIYLGTRSLTESEEKTTNVLYVIL